MNYSICFRLENRSRLSPRARQRGVTLVEWMVSITVGLFLLAGLSLLIAQQSGTRRAIDNSGRLIENGRYASQILAEDLQMAGYFGALSNIPTAPAAMPDPCQITVPELTAALPVHVQGYNAPVGSAVPSCVLNHKAGTDIVLVRRAGTQTNLLAAAVAGRIYLQSGLTATGTAYEFRLNSGPNAAFTLLQKDRLTLSALRPYLTHIYFVSNCSLGTGSGGLCAPGDDNGTWIPTLKRVELTVASGVAVLQTSALVEGIENLQIDYGLDIVPPAAASTVDGSADVYTPGTFSDHGTNTLAMAPSDWMNVVSVKVHVLARSLETEAGFQDAKTYSLGLSGSVTPGGAFKRHVFTQTVRVVNPSGRRAM